MDQQSSRHGKCTPDRCSRLVYSRRSSSRPWRAGFRGRTLARSRNAARFKSARILIRSRDAAPATGSLYSNSAAREICIAMTEHGKPYLPDHPALKFNLSHSHGALALAFSKCEVGIDIEKLRPVPDWQDLATGILSAKARVYIASEPPTKQGAACRLLRRARPCSRPLAQGFQVSIFRVRLCSIQTLRALNFLPSCPR